MEQIELTFGIPLYNNEKYIMDLLKCFKETNTVKYEIIIVDDGSTDKSLEVCKKLKMKQLKIFSKENGGVSNTRNYILEKAKGKWLTFIDSDDLIDFEKYLKSYKKLKEYNYDFFINIENAQIYKTILKCKNKLSRLIETEIINSPCSKFYNIEKLRKNNIQFNENYSLGEDLLFNLDYYKICQNIGYSQYIMYIYRKINPTSLTIKYREKKFEELMSINEICKDKFRDNIKVKKSFEYIRIKNSLSCLKSEIYFNGKNKKRINSYISKLKRYKKKQYKYLNNLKSTLIYYNWYLLPSQILIRILKMCYRIR